MSAQASITVFDGASTPVSHTLSAQETGRTEDGSLLAIWREQLVNLSDAAQVRVTAKKRKLASGVTRASFRVEVPVMETPSGGTIVGYVAPPKVAYTDTIEVTGYFSERSTLTSRRLCRMLAANLLNNVSTSVAADPAGPVAELIDKGVFAS